MFWASTLVPYFIGKFHQTKVPQPRQQCNRPELYYRVLPVNSLAMLKFWKLDMEKKNIKCRKNAWNQKRARNVFEIVYRCFPVRNLYPGRRYQRANYKMAVYECRLCSWHHCITIADLLLSPNAVRLHRPYKHVFAFSLRLGDKKWHYNTRPC